MTPKGDLKFISVKYFRYLELLSAAVTSKGRLFLAFKNKIVMAIDLKRGGCAVSHFKFTPTNEVCTMKLV